MKKPPKVIWVRACESRYQKPYYRIAFSTKADAMADCRKGWQEGCAGKRGQCAGPVKYERK